MPVHEITFNGRNNSIVKHKTPKLTEKLSRILIESTSEFFKESTLHGIKSIYTEFTNYFNSTNQSIRRKFSIILNFLIWLISCVICFIFGWILIQLVWNRFWTTPTITTIDSTNFPIWRVRFPAITLCNNNMVYAPAAEPIKQNLIDRGISNEKIDSFLHHLAKLISPDFIDEQFHDVYDVLDSMNYTTEQLMFELMEPCTNLFHRCSWLGKNISCRTAFRVVASTEGYCCSFNYNPPLDKNQVDIKNDFTDDVFNAPEYRVYGAGLYVSLDLLIHTEVTNYVSYTRSYSGTSILVHRSNSFPKGADQVAIAQPGTDVQISINPMVFISEPTVRRNLAISERNCYYDDEMKLRTTNRYSYSACISQCAVDTVLKLCNCIPFYYPDRHLFEFATYNIRECTLNDVNCLRRNQHILYSLQPDNHTETVGMECGHCLPTCSDTTYNVKTIVANRYTKDNLPTDKFVNLNAMEFSTVKIHFKEISCTKYRRDLFSSWDVLFSYFGGIFGLCLGGSIFSFIELFYYYIFKMFFNYRKMFKPNSTTTKVAPIIERDNAPISTINLYNPYLNDFQSVVTKKRNHQHVYYKSKYGHYLN